MSPGVTRDSHSWPTWGLEAIHRDCRGMSSVTIMRAMVHRKGQARTSVNLAHAVDTVTGTVARDG